MKSTQQIKYQIECLFKISVFLFFILAVVEKYLLEKSRLVSREKNERNYHVFYYLLLGASTEEQKEFYLKQPEDYAYLKQPNFAIDDGEDLRHDFERLKQAMEMVGFLPSTKKQIFSVLSAILYLGNVTYKRKTSSRDEGLEVGPPEVLSTLSQLLQVKQEMLVEALTKRKTVTVTEKLILPYSLNEAVTARDSMAKSLYSALFDWIVLRINHALLNKKDMEESVTCLSIGVLDIFGFEDFQTNSFEQFCINYANEQLQYYFNQHIFKLEQEEYQSEDISWHNIDYTDNVGCIHLISKKPTGLFYLLDEESNFPHATNQTLLAKFKQQHEGNKFFVDTPVMEPAFIIKHFAGKVKYQIKDFREKNTDYMRPDIVALLRSSDSAYIRELIGMDPVAVFRWAILRAAIRAMAVFNRVGRERAQKTAGVVRRGSRVPLGELQRANTQVEKGYRHSSLLDFSFDYSEEFSIEAFEDIFALHESKKEMHARIVKTIEEMQLQNEDPRQLLKSLNRLHQPRVPYMKSNKQKQIIPKKLMDSQSLKYIVSLTLHDRTTKSLLHLHKKKKPPSISAQFQTSLSKLMETLGRAEPFFIRCIRSNAEKWELFFDEPLVLQQLRYTGMLETVRIRRSGYSAKYTFKEFRDQFQVLLPKRTGSRQEDIASLLEKMELDKNNWQIGKTKVFLKETERQMLQDRLHEEVMGKIILLQRWFRVILARKHFLRMKEAATVIQSHWRAYRVRRTLLKNAAATVIQTLWRKHWKQKAFRLFRQRICLFQARARGYLVRKRFQKLKAEKRRMQLKQKNQQTPVKNESQTPDSHQAVVQTVDNIALRKLAGTDEMELESPSDRQKSERNSVVLQKLSSAEALDKATSSREKRENRRQRGLEHDKLQNQRTAAEQKLCITLVLEPKHDKDTDAENNIYKIDTLVPLDSGLSKQDKATDFKCKDVEGKFSKVLDQDQKRNAQSPVLPKRPNSLPLEVTNITTTPYVDHGHPEGQRDLDTSSLGTPNVLQRYADPEKLKHVAEKWKEKRDSSGHTEVADKKGLDDKSSSSHSNKGISSSLTDITNLASPKNETPAKKKDSGTPDGEELKKQFVQKKVSNDSMSSLYLDATAGLQHSQGHHMDSKSSQPKGPLHWLLGKKTDKKIKDGPTTPDIENIALTSIVCDGVSVKKADTLPRQHNQMSPGNQVLKERNTNVRKDVSVSSTVSAVQNVQLERIITNANELEALDQYLIKVCSSATLKHEDKNEALFVEAIKKFRENLKAMYTVPMWKSQITYKNLMDNYQQILNILLSARKEKPDVCFVLNLFHSQLQDFIRHYIKKGDAEISKPSKARKKKGKNVMPLEYCGHLFENNQLSIRQSCEHCTSSIWVMDKALVCKACNMICHKKCAQKVAYCPKAPCKKDNQNADFHHFGVDLCSLISDKNPVPVVMEKLLEYVEMHGLYTEGIYRKSGAANRMKDLRQRLEQDPDNVVLENYPIHAITGVLKQWLRELTEPLMTFAQYKEFIASVDHRGKQEQLHAIYKAVEQLPRASYSTLERLIFHLVKVALLEETNRMSPNALAIVFAPCILRAEYADPLTSMQDVSKTTMCVEMLINEQMRKYLSKMEEIDQLEAAESIAFRRLSLLRQNTPWPFELQLSSPCEGFLSKSLKESLDKGSPELSPLPEEDQSDSEVDQEKKILIERIKSIKEEKEDITYRLPELDQRGSDEENMDSEASVSTESLLDIRTCELDSEGAVRLRSQPPKCSMNTLTGDSKTANVPSVKVSPTPSPLILQHRLSSSLVNLKVPRRNPVIPTANLKLPHGLIKTSETLYTLPGASELHVEVKRREQPSKRNNVYSLYLAETSHQSRPEDPLSNEPAAKLKRRYSDPFFSISGDPNAAS
ncbi:unconventional myosin-IXb [Protopterus annectens]|uniref:unconventional myosin-IXb n=1 Tax=Protopterus annectens TaxID=7888 RepID=UPI001CFB765A|nr:unconventional myosin-IXb [Protopterus annectens]